MRRRGRPRSPGILTPRENDVVRLVGANLTNREVAAELGITEGGVRYHLNQVYQKLHLDTRDELVEWYRAARPRAVGFSFGLLRLGRALTSPAFVQSTALAVGGLALAGLTLVAFSLRSTEDPAAEAAQAATRPPTSTSHPGDACTISTALLEGALSARCLASVAELQAAVPFDLVAPPAVRGYEPTLFALAEEMYGPLAFARYQTPGGPLDIVQGFLGRQRDPGAPRSLSVTDPATGYAVNGFFTRSNDPALSGLWWCPEIRDAECNGGRQVGLHGFSESELERLALDMATEMAGLSPFAANTPVPFPPPLGERVEAIVAVPSYPDAEEVDGFLTTGRSFGMEMEVEQAVQVFETSDFPEQIFAYYMEQLGRAGWKQYKGASGVAGSAMEFTRNDETEWVSVGTYYLPRPGEARPEPPPGFRGKGIPFDLHQNGKTRFLVVTWTQ